MLLSDLEETLQEALKFHKAGMFSRAQELYSKILDVDPKNFDSLRLLGILCLQNRNYTMAEHCLLEAASIRPLRADLHNNIGNSRQALGRLHEALDSYNVAISLNAGYTEALSNKGNVLASLGLYEDALRSYEDAILADDKFPDSYNNKGFLLHSLEQFELAIPCYDKAISLNGNYYEAFNNKGSSLFSLHRYDQALESFDQALRINPGYVEALNNKGNVLKELKEYNAALLSFDKAIFLNNNHALAHNGKGAVLLELLQYQAAISCFDAALQSKPNYESAFNNRSIALWKLNLLDEALTSVDKAIELKPDYAEAYVTKANVLIAKNLLTDALVCFDKAIYLQPAYADAYWNKSLLQLLIGDFRGGWENYEWRWKIKDGLLKKVDLKLPLWLGKDSLRGKHILLHWEQGLGDTIQFSRFLPLVTEQANTVVAIVQSPLIELISAAYPDVHFQLKEDPLPTGIDFYCPLLSLPLALNSCPDTIPFSKGYLSADADKIRYWSALLGEQKSLRVGLAWSGSEGHKNDGNRSIRLEQLIPFLPSGCEYVCLQKDIRQSDEAALSGSQIRCFSEQLNDFTDTAALCELMDLVISVDTSIAHLSGALGKSAWVLLPYRPDWRWMLDRNDSVWYEKMLLIRQATAGDWESALLQLRTKLDELLNSSDDK